MRLTKLFEAGDIDRIKNLLKTKEERRKTKRGKTKRSKAVDFA